MNKINKEIPEDMEQTVFQIISYAGDAKSNSLMALDFAGKNNFDDADKCINEANEELIKAHDLHSKLLQRFSLGEKVEVNILLTHAQDHFMNAILARDLISEMVIIMKNNKRKAD